jgi:hypothetical protein
VLPTEKNQLATKSDDFGEGATSVAPFFWKIGTFLIYPRKMGTFPINGKAKVG